MPLNIFLSFALKQALLGSGSCHAFATEKEIAVVHNWQ